jgi:hypothetical protein
MDHLVKEAIEMWLHPDGFNRPLWHSKKTGTYKNNGKKDLQQTASCIFQVKQHGLCVD